ncbi:MAG TPA: metal-dependent hydrolase [Reyranella sp.]|nr:metal-dependent hydrolase [Reyranella sp.]
MPSSVAHGFAAAALGAALLPGRVFRRLALSGVASAVLLDIDAIGRPFGHGDIGWLGGHRALTHSLFFAAVVGGLLVFFWRRRLGERGMRLRAFAFFFTAMAAHGVLDTFTDYGDGVAFLAPLSWERFESSWEPFQGLWEEVIIVWLPCYLLLRYARRNEKAVLAPTRE